MIIMKKTLLERVELEKGNYTSGQEAAIDHLKMAHFYLFETWEGKDDDFILSDIKTLISVLKDEIII